MYGCRGWVLHHNTDLWRMNGAVDGLIVDRGLPVMRGYVQHLWDRYLYSGDKEYLASVYPYSEECFRILLIFSKRSQYRLSGSHSSNSPENSA